MAGINKVIVRLYSSGLSIPQVAEQTGKHRSTVRHHLKNAGILRTRSEGIRKAAEQGRLGSGMRGKTRSFSDEHRSNISKSRKAHADMHAAGVSKKPNGYLEVTRGPDKGRGLHRVIAERIIGRPLSENEVVHHVDGDPSNNAPSNLKVMTHREHCSHHALENYHTRQRDALGRFR